MLKFPPEEIGRRRVRLQPGPMQQKPMNLIGQNHLLEIHALFPQRRHKLRLVGQGFGPAVGLPAGAELRNSKVSA